MTPPPAVEQAFMIDLPVAGIFSLLRTPGLYKPQNHFAKFMYTALQDKRNIDSTLNLPKKLIYELIFSVHTDYDHRQ